VVQQPRAVEQAHFHEAVHHPNRNLGHGGHVGPRSMPLGILRTSHRPAFAQTFLVPGLRTELQDILGQLTPVAIAIERITGSAAQ
jgi:hypothetical protein